MIDEDRAVATSTITVELIQHVGGDDEVIAAARVSTGSDAEPRSVEQNRGLIGYLMRNRHGSPFEHGSMTFRISAPVVFWWEQVRHRIGWSYNLESGRYKQLEGRFYVPEHARKQAGKPGHYQIVEAPELDTLMQTELKAAAEASWGAYRRMLDGGIANEVARLALPFSIYYSGYVTCNPRSLMAFMSLRTEHSYARYPSKPQKEIRIVGDYYEAWFSQAYPETHAAWHAAGRVAP
jgi:thymidylate synthase (FAD)